MSNNDFFHNTQLWGGLVNFGNHNSATTKGSTHFPNRPAKERKISEHEWDHEISSLSTTTRKYSED